MFLYLFGVNIGVGTPRQVIVLIIIFESVLSENLTILVDNNI